MNEKIKILHIQESLSFGGVERRRLSLAKHLDRNQYEQKIICTTTRGDIIEDIRSQGVEVFEIGKFLSPFQWSQHKKVQKIIDEYQPHIIHGAVFEGVTMAAVNGWYKKVPFIIIEETSDPKNRSWKGNLLMKLFSKIADKVVGVSQGVTEEYLKGQLNIPKQKVMLINNGVALPRKVSLEEIKKAKSHWGIGEHDFVIGSTGRMLQDAHKRFSDLIKAFARFSDGKQNIKLLLVGDGPEKAGYEKLAKELGIFDKVVFAGYQSDVTLFYNLMNVFALFSAYEAFGLVLAEAMLNRLPVIATRVGGMKFIVEEGETGYLVKPFDVDEMAARMEMVFQNSDLRINMAEKGLMKARIEYTEEIYVKKVKDLYDLLFTRSQR